MGTRASPYTSCPSNW
ncbi:hypothetical protein JI435_423830 [Parastagonospora nodorum SN15]|nr:hypothetical protein JI435_423830 [Parastagonospora nodorum SN15]